MISRLLGIATLVCLLFAWTAGVAKAERRIALVIGNSAYKNVAQLPNPARDAAAIAAMLEKAGFDVVEHKSDLGNLKMRRVLRDFARKARRADIAVVYYAGHGIEVDGINYLIPVDAKLASDIDVYDEAIPLTRIVSLLEPVRRLRLVILDACRENPFASKMTRTITTRAIGRGLAGVQVTSTDTLVAFAAKAGMTAEDGSGAHSPYTAALLDNLAVPGLDLRLALGRVRDEVMKSTDDRQEPYFYGSIGGTAVSLVPKPHVAVKPPVPASSADAEARDYAFAERIGTRQAWDTFLAAHKSGFYADLARAARDKIAAAHGESGDAARKATDETAKRQAADEAAAKRKAAEEAAAKKAATKKAATKKAAARKRPKRRRG